MQATAVIDKAGRILIPKRMRDYLHLQPGSKLRLEQVGDKLELSVEEPEVKIVTRGGVRVVVGWEGFDAAKAVREMRAEQVGRLEKPFRH